MDPSGAAAQRRTPDPRHPKAEGYYGLPVVKPPVWTWEVPVYLFTGGLAGMASVVVLAALLFGDPLSLARTAAWVALAGAVVSPALLASDLGRPKRFIAMLRVFKWRSPMSVGSWLLTVWGAFATGTAAFVEWRHHVPGSAVLAVFAIAAAIPAALLGALVATYTGVLLGATAIPTWYTHRVLLPVHFVTAGLGSATGALELLGFLIAPLNVLGFLAAGVETLVGAAVELRRGRPYDNPLHRGKANLLMRIAGVLAGPAAIGLRVLELPQWAAAAFLLGVFASRFGWVLAGRLSAKEPPAALIPQERARRAA